MIRSFSNHFGMAVDFCQKDMVSSSDFFLLSTMKRLSLKKRKRKTPSDNFHSQMIRNQKLANDACLLFSF